MIGAAGNYAELHAGGDTHLVRGTMASLEARLPSERFVRIHRSTIVNLDRVESAVPGVAGGDVRTLKGTVRIPSRSLGV